MSGMLQAFWWCENIQNVRTSPFYIFYTSSGLQDTLPETVNTVLSYIEPLQPAFSQAFVKLSEKRYLLMKNDGYENNNNYQDPMGRLKKVMDLGIFGAMKEKIKEMGNFLMFSLFLTSSDSQTKNRPSRATSRQRSTKFKLPWIKCSMQRLKLSL